MAPLIELEHVVDALQGFARPLREGREAMKHLVVCGVAFKSAQVVRVEALCVRTTKISEPPVNIKVSINLCSKKVEDKITSISCTCPSGASKEHSCKHAMACLLYLERNDESSLETLTCTDMEQRWGGIRQEVMTQFKAVPLTEFCHMGIAQSPYRRDIKDVTEEMRAKFRNMFIEAQPNSEAAVFLSGVRHNITDENQNSIASGPSPNIQRLLVNYALENQNYIINVAKELGESLYEKCTPQQQDYYNKYIQIEGDAVLNICNETADQDSDKWLEYKYGRLTGSISYSFSTYYKNRKKHTDDDWKNKIKSTYGPSYSNQNMQDGKEHEKRAKLCYERKFPDRAIHHLGIFINPAVPWLGYSADGIICVADSIDRLWEVKSPVKGAIHGADTICSALSYMKMGKLKEKHDYYGQIQLGMLLLSIPICDFTVFCHKPDEVYVDTVVFNDKWCLEFVKNLTYGYFTQVLPWLASQSEC